MDSLARGSFSSSIDYSELESNLSLKDRLKGFKSSKYDVDAYVTSKCQAMTEKEIKHLCFYLGELKKASAEEMRKSVYANYGAFIRTSREITDLEGELLLLRNHLSTQAALVHGLAEAATIESLSGDLEDSTAVHSSNQSSELRNTDEWLVEYLDNLEVLMVERRMDEALAALDEGEQIAKNTNRRKNLSAAALSSLQTAIRDQRQKLASLLEQTICQPSTRGVELRSAAQALKKLGDGARAHMLLLNSHHQKLQRSLQSFRSSNSGGGAFTAAISQFVFSTIAQAASDSMAVFGEEPAYASELVTWSLKQTDAFAVFLKRHVIASSAAVGSLRIAAECVQICMGHCSLLQARGLALSPVLFRHFRPLVENGITANLRRIEQTSAALAAADDWLLAYSPVASRLFLMSASASSLGSLSQPKLSSSAHRFNTMVQEFLEDMGSLESLQLDALTLEGVLQVFNSYINLLITALPSSVENEMNLEGSATKIVRLAETESQQIALLANASLLADELIPRAATKLFPANRSETPRKSSSSRVPEQREWKRRLQRSVDRLRDSFCRQHALELIFTEEGDTRLNAQMYLSMDGNGEEPEWFPSQIFQALFEKLTRIASIATDMFVGRERFATVLLMRLTETVILWLSEDQAFWEEVEEGPRPIGPFGLQQFYLDMEFVILFASQGRYLSRNLHQVIKNIIARAIESLASTGTDPYSALPEDDWFAEVAQIAIKMLSGKANFSNVDRDPTSPTASVSAKSISSVHSHGSN
ncbi:exocyst complex component EXO84A isoform X2 [Momordica charantia]|uniref:Exocyst complex component EXO84A isoform X2 n=1 Tax=Momordica charantia TaxID=3673 RepID=A0A6J1DW91_MOMCH|nr:exocyst complex component EXO84A isoform X2 [Momordica charantia]